MHQVARDSTTSTALISAMSIVEAKERVHTKDWAAFERLYEYYRKPLGQRLMYLVGDRDVAYDLYQDTFERLWKKLSIEDPIKNFEAWLYEIARNLAIDHLRRIKRMVFLSFPESDSDEPGDQTLLGLLSVPGHEEHICEIACIRQALEEMSPQYRTCLLLQVMWGYSQHEIAAALEISEKSVSANVSRGRAQLRAAYRDMLHDPNARKGGRK
jgi:RNA polymerase sigma-70 factor, ECF subfamily